MKYQDIKEMFTTAFRTGDKVVANTLRTLIGEVDLERSRSKKFDEDASVQAVLKRFIKDAKTLQEAKPDDLAIADEIKVLESLVPKKMSDDEIQAELQKNAFTALPDVMKHFKQFGQSVDMQRVRQLFTA